MFAGMILLLANGTFAQTRCFEVKKTNISVNDDWRDSSFIVCTDDPAVLADVDNELLLPFSQRQKIVSGNISASNGGYNSNATHDFLWHFKTSYWTLTGSAIELCDGLAYSHVDANIAYWLDTVGSFCPWYYRVNEEVKTASFRKSLTPSGLVLFPTSSTGSIRLTTPEDIRGRLSVLNPAGQIVLSQDLQLEAGAVMSLDVSSLVPGTYICRVDSGEGTMIARFSRI